MPRAPRTNAQFKFRSNRAFLTYSDVGDDAAANAFIVAFRDAVRTWRCHEKWLLAKEPHESKQYLLTLLTTGVLTFQTRWHMAFPCHRRKKGRMGHHPPHIF